MTTEPEHVRPRTKPQALQLGAATQLPAGSDQLGHMRRQLVETLQIGGGDEAPVQAAAEALGGLGRVLGDVAGHLLGRQLPGLAIGLANVAHVELLTPAGKAARPPVQGWAGYPDSRDRLSEASSSRSAVNGSGGGARQAGQR